METNNVNVPVQPFPRNRGSGLQPSFPKDFPWACY